MSRPQKWNIRTMTEWSRKTKAGIIPLEEPAINVKSLIKWKCLYCNHVFEQTFDIICCKQKYLKATQFCPNCHLENKTDQADSSIFTNGTPLSAYLAGALTARSWKIPHEPKNNCQCVFRFSTPSQTLMDTLLNIARCQAKTAIAPNGKSVYAAIRNTKFCEAVQSAPKLPPQDPILARAWSRGHFDMAGHTETYPQKNGPIIHKITVTGDGERLKAILHAFHLATENKRGKVQVHVRRNSTITTELHFSGRGSSMAFLEWLHNDPTLPPPSKDTIKFINKNGTALQEKKTKDDRLAEDVRKAALLSLEAHNISVISRAKKLGISRSQAYQVIYGNIKASNSVTKALKETYNKRRAIRQRIANMTARIAHRYGLNTSSVRGYIINASHRTPCRH